MGEPVIRGDPEVAGEHAARFDPTDPESVERAARTVRAFSESSADGTDNVYVLQGAAACAALVRGVGSYKAAAERAGGDATVSFIRKWARVHDLPRPIRRYVATGRIAPTAAKHIARVAGEARYTLAWAVLDHGLTVREIRAVVSRVNKNQTVEEALEAEGVRLGQMEVRLPPLEQNPFFTECHNALGMVHAQLGQHDQALQEFQAVLADINYPTPEVAHFNIGKIFWEKQACSDAVIHFRRALEVNPRFGRAWYLMGDCQEQTGQVDLARESYEKALELSGDDVNIMYRLGIVSFQQGDHAHARRWFEKVRTHAPGGELAAAAREYIRQMDFR